MAASDGTLFDDRLEEARPHLVMLCARVVGHDHAEDATQEAMIKIWSAAARFDPARGAFLPWASRIARNAAIDHLRRQSGRRADLSLDIAGGVGLDDRISPSSLSLLMDAETRTEVRTAAGELPDLQVEALFKAYWLGLSHEAIALATQVPLGTAKGRVRMGLARLRTGMGEVRPE